jgi:hypothetical protein
VIPQTRGFFVPGTPPSIRLNEVRILGGSRMENGGVMTADKTIKLKPDATVLATSKATRSTSGSCLVDGFFAELESRYT